MFVCRCLSSIVLVVIFYNYFLRLLTECFWLSREQPIQVMTPRYFSTCRLSCHLSICTQWHKRNLSSLFEYNRHVSVLSAHHGRRLVGWCALRSNSSMVEPCPLPPLMHEISAMTYSFLKSCPKLYKSRHLIAYSLLLFLETLKIRGLKKGIVLNGLLT